MEHPKIDLFLNTSESNIDEELYLPCFQWADTYDRGVGFFTSGWLSHNIKGISNFAARKGKMRFITSPIMSDDDVDAIINSTNKQYAYEKFEKALLENIDKLENEMSKDILNAFSWLLYDRIIEMKFAIPCEKLKNGDFHDKFGIFTKGEEAISFSGSINDSIKGFNNYESIKVFNTWNGTEEYVNADKKRFEKLWSGSDKNLILYNIPTAVENKIFKLRNSSRPYRYKDDNKWRHQEEAVSCFMKEEHGILAMATGSGKTKTAIKIIDRLFNENKIKRVIITMYGNDLLDQWASQIREKYVDKQIYYNYRNNQDMMDFLMHPDNSILLISRESNNLVKLLDSIDKLPFELKDDTLLLFDEVHGAGSNSFVENLSGKISPYKYRLGLSATPEREYDDEGNQFLLNEIGDIIYKFTLKDAIERGILCEFNYIPLNYTLTDDEKEKKRKIIAKYNTQKEKGDIIDETEMFTKLSLINKTAINKIDEFENFIINNMDLLSKSIIFVQTQEYGKLLQEVLIKYTDRYHTYYADDDKYNLEKFAKGDFDLLLTCKKISEGIDISSVTNIFLFSSDRSKLVTTQRIGRALRLDNQNINKKANIIDFVLSDNSKEDLNADEIRKEWLMGLSKIRRKTNEE